MAKGPDPQRGVEVLHTEGSSVGRTQVDTHLGSGNLNGSFPKEGDPKMDPKIL